MIMTILDYDKLAQEIAEVLEKNENLTLATSANDIVTGRTMCHVNDGLMIMMGTQNGSLKVEQIRLNKNVALICGPLQIEAAAELYGPPSRHPVYMDINDKKFPWMKSAFPPDPDNEDGSMLVICHPKKISCYKFIEGRSFWDVLDVEGGKAYRQYG